MPTTLTEQLKSRLRISKPVKSLSAYFPAGTQYFYAYPAGESADFINHVSPTTEELIAARAYGCAGPDISVVAYANTGQPVIEKRLLDKLGIPQLNSKQVILLPASITPSLTGIERNDAILKALKACTRQGRLVMAQPFLSKSFISQYQIPPHITSWLNDKINLSSILMGVMVPARLATYSSSAQFIANHTKLSLPYVVKASASSAGDGVHICRSAQDVQKAIDQFQQINTTIIVEEYVSIKKNYGIHFGIPHSANNSIDILGFNEQVTSSSGKFLGGIIEPQTLPTVLQPVVTYLQEQVLPRVRRMGWYGVGCFDVLIDEYDKPYFIDANFRMTGMTTYHFMRAAQKISVPLISFSGSFKGTQEAFENIMGPLAGKHVPDRTLQIIALNHHDNTWGFNAALMLPNFSRRAKEIELLLEAGIRSPGLTQLADTLNRSSL